MGSRAPGLYDYRARFYDPALGRFLQPDPLVPEPGNPQALNRYAYVTNNPLRYTDPSGHWLETVWDIINIGWDIYEVRRDPGNTWNWVALVVDVGAAVLPFVPAGAGMVVRGGKAIAHVDDAARLARIAARTERFAGASPEIRRGVKWLAKIVESPDVFPPYRYGLEKQLKRAEMLYEQGVLQGVEVLIEGGRVDFVLITDEVVEFKYWRQSYVAENVGELAKQLKAYQAPGRPVLLELGRTRTDPITEAYLDKLLKALQSEGVNITREQIRIVDLE